MAAVWLVDQPGSRLMQLTALRSPPWPPSGYPRRSASTCGQFYTTDSAAFNQVAAHLLVHGKNPYTHSMAPAAGLLNSPDRFWTYLVNGSYVLHVSYPAGSFLLEAPLMALGFRHEVTDWLDLAAWLVTGVLLFVMMPVSLRWLAALILLTSVYVGMFTNGGTDVLFLPFLVLAVWRWDRFATGRGAGLAGWLGPVCLGLACSIKQTPWFCVPFLVVGVALEARRSGRGIGIGTGARYLAIVVAVFVAVNLPFIVWSPGAWARGIVLPLTKGLVADGQGAVTLAVHGPDRRGAAAAVVGGRLLGVRGPDGGLRALVPADEAGVAVAPAGGPVRPRTEPDQLSRRLLPGRHRRRGHRGRTGHPAHHGGAAPGRGPAVVAGRGRWPCRWPRPWSWRWWRSPPPR